MQEVSGCFAGDVGSVERWSSTAFPKGTNGSNETQHIHRGAFMAGRGYRMRVVLFPSSYPPYPLGGLEIAVKKLAEHLAMRGCTVMVVTGSLGWWPCKQLDTEWVTVHRVPLGLPSIVIRHGFRRLMTSLVHTVLRVLWAPLSLLYLLWLVRAFRPDVVNLHYIAGNAAFCLSARTLLNFKLLVSIHGTDIKSYPHRSVLMRWVTKRALEVADRVLSNSAALLRDAERISASVVGKSVVVGNGVDMAEFVSSPQSEYAQQRYVLCAARLVFNKGIDVLIEAFEMVHQMSGDLTLLIAGDVIERRKCAALVEELGLGGVLELLGRVEPAQIPSLLAGCDLFVLPSRQESFGIAILEAMASRKAVIATRVGGVPELVRHMENGLLVDAESPQKLARAMVLLIQDNELRDSLAEAGHETVKSRFTWEKVVDKYLDVYRQVGNQERS